MYIYIHMTIMQRHYRADTYNGEWIRKLVCGNHEVFQLLLVEKGTAAKINQDLNKVYGGIVVSRPHVTEWCGKCSANCENTGWPNSATKEVDITDAEEIIKAKLVWQSETGAQTLHSSCK